MKRHSRLKIFKVNINKMSNRLNAIPLHLPFYTSWETDPKNSYKYAGDRKIAEIIWKKNNIIGGFILPSLKTYFYVCEVLL